MELPRSLDVFQESWEPASKALGAQLARAARLYRRHEVPEKETRYKTLAGHIDMALSPLFHMRALPSAALMDIVKFENLALVALSAVFMEVLPELPFISSDMQVLHGMDWRAPRGEIGDTIRTLFEGLREDGRDGLRSGYVADGGIAAWIEELLIELRRTSQSPARQPRPRFGISETDGRIARARQSARMSPSSFQRYWRARV